MAPPPDNSRSVLRSNLASQIKYEEKRFRESQNELGMLDSNSDIPKGNYLAEADYYLDMA